MNIAIERDSQITLRERVSTVEVGGYSVRCIASNIRAKDKIDWGKFCPVNGIGFEGNLLLGQIELVGARREMECLAAGGIIDIPLVSGDYIVGVLANRHSGTSEYGEVPKEGINITAGENIDLIAAGGIMGKCLGVPKTLGDSPTRVKAIGLLAWEDRKVADLTDLYPRWEESLLPTAPIILSLGTAAEIGKTTTAAKLIEGLKSAGIKKVAASKLAGTGRKRDIKILEKAGANPAYDFPDVGLATTYTSVERYIPATYTLLNKINREGNPDLIIAECGGDIIEGNIPTLLHDPNIREHVVAIIHGSTDVLSIIGSLILYARWEILSKIPIYLTYPIKRNYFAIHERLKEQGIDLPIFDPMNNEETALVIKDILQSF